MFIYSIFQTSTCVLLFSWWYTLLSNWLKSLFSRCLYVFLCLYVLSSGWWYVMFYLLCCRCVYILSSGWWYGMFCLSDVYTFYVLGDDLSCSIFQMCICFISCWWYFMYYLSDVYICANEEETQCVLKLHRWVQSGIHDLWPSVTKVTLTFSDHSDPWPSLTKVTPDLLWPRWPLTFCDQSDPWPSVTKVTPDLLWPWWPRTFRTGAVVVHVGKMLMW